MKVRTGGLRESRRLLGGFARTLVRGAIDFVYPPTCLGCGGPAPAWSPHLCPRCEAAISGPGVATTIDTAAGTIPVYAASWMAGPMESLVHALKYRRMLAAAPVVAGHMARAASPAIAGRPGVLLVSVPLDPPRRRERGFNQAELLARLLAEEAGVIAAPRWVRKHRATGSQTRLGRAARRANIRDSMSAAPGVSFRGRRVWLVDDVATTGATLGELARAAGAAGGEVEGAIVAARTADS